jgi:hypothetical protein
VIAARKRLSPRPEIRSAAGIFLLSAIWCFGGTPQSTLGSDAQYRRDVVGVWEDNYQGHRIMTVRADGTATMVVELHGWKARLYASELRFEMTWSIQNGLMTKQTTGGEPPGKVKTILKLMGDRVQEKIVELTSDRLVLLDKDGKRQYEWRRVKPKQ